MLQLIMENVQLIIVDKILYFFYIFQYFGWQINIFKTCVLSLNGPIIKKEIEFNHPKAHKNFVLQAL